MRKSNVKKRKLSIKRIVKLNILIALLAIMFLLIIHSTSLSFKDIEYREIYVSKGDTLWDIAKSEQENNDYYKGKNIREIIFDIKKVNNLSNSELAINQKILIPSF